MKRLVQHKYLGKVREERDERGGKLAISIVTMGDSRSLNYNVRGVLTSVNL